MANDYVGASFQGKGDVRNFSANKGVKWLEHAMEVIESVLERRIREVCSR